MLQVLLDLLGGVRLAAVAAPGVPASARVQVVPAVVSLVGLVSLLCGDLGQKLGLQFVDLSFQLLYPHCLLLIGCLQLLDLLFQLNSNSSHQV